MVRFCRLQPSILLKGSADHGSRSVNFLHYAKSGVDTTGELSNGVRKTWTFLRASEDGPAWTGPPRLRRTQVMDAAQADAALGRLSRGNPIPRPIPCAAPAV